MFQATILRDMEKFAGWWRIGFIYFASGIGGTMLSAILIPYQPEVCCIITPVQGIFSLSAGYLVSVLPTKRY